MKIAVDLSQPDRKTSLAVPRFGIRGAWLAAIILAFLAVMPEVRTQVPRVPPAGVLVGPTRGSSFLNAADATGDQARAVGAAANKWARHANSANYRVDLYPDDARVLRLRFQVLRERFNWMVSLTMESNPPQAINALTELDAGLNIIEELLLFLDQQFQEGSLDRATLVRTCKTLEDLMHAWESDLRRNSPRVGLAL